jgi:hypothetical protein
MPKLSTEENVDAIADVLEKQILVLLNLKGVRREVR